jgi:hypothetical protein
MGRIKKTTGTIIEISAFAALNASPSQACLADDRVVRLTFT